MTKEISNMDDVIDSRDVIARIEDLEDGRKLDKGEKAELKALKELAEQGESIDDWKYGAQLIRDSHFKDYAEELAEDCGDIKKETHWPHTCIDWDQAARELQMDYTSVDFDGVTYWVR